MTICRFIFTFVVGIGHRFTFYALSKKLSIDRRSFSKKVNPTDMALEAKKKLPDLTITWPENRKNMVTMLATSS